MSTATMSKPDYAPVAAARKAMSEAHQTALRGVGEPGNEARWATYDAAVAAWCDADKAYGIACKVAS